MGAGLISACHPNGGAANLPAAEGGRSSVSPAGTHGSSGATGGVAAGSAGSAAGSGGSARADASTDADDAGTVSQPDAVWSPLSVMAIVTPMEHGAAGDGKQDDLA